MKIIYEPKGAALEYAPLAANLYSGCAHGCKYCFAPGVLRRTREDFHKNVTVRKDALKLFEADCLELADKNDDREILLSFATDPYQPIEATERITRQAIIILQGYNLRFTILTKGGMAAARDFDLLAGYDKCSFGISLVFSSGTSCSGWETFAAGAAERRQSIKAAHELGIKTWVSMEPVIYTIQALEVVEDLPGVVDHWKVGKLNRHKFAVEPDWGLFCRNLKDIFDANGADYYIKDSLKPYWPKEGA